MSLRTSSERLASQLSQVAGENAVLREPIAKVHALVEMLMHNPSLWTLLGALHGTPDFDKVTVALVDAAVATRSGYFLHIVRQLANADLPPSIMRSNGMCSRVISHYAKRLGSKYIQKMLGNLLAEVALDDVTKLDPQDSDSPSEEKEAMLVKKVTTFLNRILHEDFLREMPPEIKVTTGFVEEMAAAFCPDHTCPLLGGFLLLRFINPHIISPDAHGIIPADQLKPPQRHNLVLISKTLQQISNQNQQQEARGAAFPILQEWIMANQSRMITYLFTVATEGRRTWTQDFSSAQPRPIPFNAVKFEDYLLLHSFIVSVHQKIVAAAEIQKTKSDYAERAPLITAFTKLAEEIALATLRPSNALELVYSPLDADSRAVQLLLVDLKIEFTSRRVDPLHSKVVLEGIVRGRSPFLQLPYLIDGEAVLSGGCTILRYLASKFFISDSWYPSLPQQRAAVDQLLDWLTTAVHQPVALLFTRGLQSGVEAASACPVDLSKALETIETRLHSGFLCGSRMSIADLLLVCHLSCYNVFMPDALSAYPLIQQLRTVAEDRLSGWRIIHKEFELLRQYAVVERHRESISSLHHSVYFPMPPREVYETLMDPDMFPTGFERNATLVPRTPRGGRTQPVISREVGGRFVVPLRNGVQLLLLPDVKVVQKSTLTDWPDGTLPSIDVYEMKPFERHTLLRFSQLNIPEDSAKQLDELWDRFWRKMRGIRTTHLDANFCFPNISPKLFFDTYLDGDRLGTLLKKPCTMKRGHLENFTILDSAASGQTLHIIPHQTIVQKWRASDWPESHFSLLTLELRSLDTAGSIMTMSQSDVPQDREKSTVKLLNKIWKALGGIAVQTVVHAVFVPDTRTKVWKFVNDAKHVRENVPQGGSEFKMFGSLLHGSHKEVSPPFLAVQTQQYHHKEWPADYYCDTSIEFNEHDNDTTLLRLTHHNLPEDFSKIALDAWETLWNKLPGACRVENISRTIAFPATTHRIYDFLLNSDEMGKALRVSTCIIQRRLNSSWLITDGKIEYTGILQRFLQDRVITMTWRASDWPAQHSSLVSIKLSPWNQTAGDQSCLVWVQQFRVPIARMKETNAFWEKLWSAVADVVKPK